MKDRVTFHQMVAEVQCASGLLLSMMPSWCSIICAQDTNQSDPIVIGSGKEETLDFLAIYFDVLQSAVCIFCCRHQ